MSDYITKGLHYIYVGLIWIRDAVGSFIYGNFSWIGLVSLGLIFIFIAGIIYISIKIEYFYKKQEDLIDMFGGVGKLFKHKALKKWREIKIKLSSGSSARWKQAIVEADDLLNEVLKELGYLGIHLTPKLNILTTEQLLNLEEIKQVNKIVNQIKTDSEYQLTRAEAIRIAKIYQKAFQQLNLI